MTTYYQPDNKRIALLQQSSSLLQSILAVARSARTSARAMREGGETYVNIEAAIQDILDEGEDLLANLAATLAKVNWTYVQVIKPQPRELNFAVDYFGVTADNGGKARISCASNTFSALQAGDLIEISNADDPSNNRNQSTTVKYMTIDAVAAGYIDLTTKLSEDTTQDKTMTITLIGH